MNNYIKTKSLDLNLYELRASCEIMRDIIIENFKPVTDKCEFTGQDTVITGLFGKYNMLMYPLSQVWDLYEEIKIFFREIHPHKDPYFIQCWLNYYNYGDFIDWHGHWDPHFNSYHGYFCVDTEPSKTTYKLPNDNSPLDVISKDNLLVLSGSNGDVHRTWPWTDKHRPRITIAFDIVPAIYCTHGINHWVPI